MKLIIFADIILGLHATGMWAYVFIRNQLGQMVWEESTVWMATAEFYLSIVIFLFFLVQLPFWIIRMLRD